MEKKPQFLHRNAVTAYLKQRGVACSPKTLAKLATENRGPKYRVIGRNALSTVDEVDQWLESFVENEK